MLQPDMYLGMTDKLADKIDIKNKTKSPFLTRTDAFNKGRTDVWNIDKQIRIHARMSQHRANKKKLCRSCQQRSRGNLWSIDNSRQLICS